MPLPTSCFKWKFCLLTQAEPGCVGAEVASGAGVCSLPCCCCRSGWGGGGETPGTLQAGVWLLLAGARAMQARASQHRAVHPAVPGKPCPASCPTCFGHFASQGATL